MVGRHARRLVDAVPYGHWKTTTLIGALRCDAVTTTGPFDGAINSEPFLVYVKQILVPTQKTGE
jgi:hypothetical protein